jgi:hypothetical protein
MLLVPILALALTQPVVPQSAVPRSYAACISTPEPVVCVTELAVTGDRGFELSDLIAAGAVAAARRQAPARGRRIVELAARIAAGEGHEGLSPVEAQHVLALFSDVSFYDSGLPGDARAIGLWDIAMREPVGDIELRGVLVQAAVRSNREALAERLVAEAPVNGRWSDDARAEFASIAARMTYDWRVAEAFLASGGDRADGYSIPEIRIGIDQARLHKGYDREAAARVLADILSDDELLPWPQQGWEALKAGGATEELRALGTALVSRGRGPGRSPEDRTDDFGLASWAFRAAGDRGAALAAAREGMAFVPEAVEGRGDLSSFGTWPVRELFQLAPDEAVASGFLWGRDRYEGTATVGGQADPAWLAGPRMDFLLKLVVPTLQQRRAVSDARALLLRLRAAPVDWASANAEELMMLAAIAGDGRQVEAIFNDAVRDLDESEDMVTWAALQLVIGRRAADAELLRDRTDPQSP